MPTAATSTARRLIPADHGPAPAARPSAAGQEMPVTLGAHHLVAERPCRHRRRVALGGAPKAPVAVEEHDFPAEPLREPAVRRLPSGEPPLDEGHGPRIEEHFTNEAAHELAGPIATREHAVVAQEIGVRHEDVEIAKPAADALREGAAALEGHGVEVLAAGARVVDDLVPRSRPSIAQLDVLVADLRPVLVEHQVSIDHDPPWKGEVHRPEIPVWDGLVGPV